MLQAPAGQALEHHGPCLAPCLDQSLGLSPHPNASWDAEQVPTELHPPCGRREGGRRSGQRWASGAFQGPSSSSLTLVALSASWGQSQEGQNDSVTPALHWEPCTEGKRHLCNLLFLEKPSKQSLDTYPFNFLRE